MKKFLLFFFLSAIVTQAQYSKVRIWNDSADQTCVGFIIQTQLHFAFHLRHISSKKKPQAVRYTAFLGSTMGAETVNFFKLQWRARATKQRCAPEILSGF